jgi:NTE family protein
MDLFSSRLYVKKVLLLLLLNCLPAFYCLPQSKQYAYRNLVLEGGGIRGIAYTGALSELETMGILPSITRVGGTSAGAIQAALLATGHSADEILQLTTATPIQRFSDGRLFFAGGFTRLINQYGWYRGERFRRWLHERIAHKTGNGDLTFAQLHQLAGQHGFRDLYVTATDLTRQKVVILSFETFPDMKVKDAVRISMSIPLFFSAVAVDTNGHIIKKPNHNHAVSIMVDGGIVANYPITLFDHLRYADSTANTATQPTNVRFINPETIGIRLDRAEQIAYDQQGLGLAPYPIHNFREYLGALYTIIIENLNRQALQAEDWQRTISIDVTGFNPKIRKLTQSQIRILTGNGQLGVKNYFERR